MHEQVTISLAEERESRNKVGKINELGIKNEELRIGSWEIRNRI